MATAREYFDQTRRHIRPIPQGLPGETCPYCLGPVSSGFARCWSCNRLFHQNGAPLELARSLVPMSAVLNPGPWYTRFSTFKNVGQQARVELAAFLHMFLRHQLERLEALAGGPFDAVTVVPSKRGVPYEEQPLQRVVGAACGLDPLRERLEVVGLLTHSGGSGGPARAAYRPGEFVLARDVNVAGIRVLLVEDLWVSGATATSAAGSLMEAGAASVVIAPLGREFHDNDFCPPAYLKATEREYDLSHFPRDYDDGSEFG